MKLLKSMWLRVEWCALAAFQTHKLLDDSQPRSIVVLRRWCVCVCMCVCVSVSGWMGFMGMYMYVHVLVCCVCARVFTACGV